jgi:DNA-binding transcriptional LysR family regulator
MDINNLQAFIAIAQTRSFSIAAERQFVTQPAISKRIAALESVLNARLFHRSGRRVRLTEAGEALIPSAQRIIDEFAHSVELISRLEGAVGGRLRIGTSHHIGLHRLPPVLSEYTSRYPAVELDIHFMDSEEACASVDRGELELAVATLPESPFPRLQTILVWPDPLDFVVGNNHPLAAQARIDITTLAQHRAIMPARGTVTREILDKALLPHNLRLQIKMETNYLETIKMMVSVGLGWSLLPRSMGEGLIALAIDGLDLQRRLGIAWEKKRSLSNAAQTFIDCCRSPLR